MHGTQRDPRTTRRDESHAHAASKSPQPAAMSATRCFSSSFGILPIPMQIGQRTFFPSFSRFSVFKTSSTFLLLFGPAAAAAAAPLPPRPPPTLGSVRPSSFFRFGTTTTASSGPAPEALPEYPPVATITSAPPLPIGRPPPPVTGGGGGVDRGDPAASLISDGSEAAFAVGARFGSGSSKASS